jgi:hypothetical protein
MRKLGMMILILLGAVTLLGNNYALAKGPKGEAHFDAMDTDKDGKVSRKEHAAKCEKRFSAMDTNKDGYLTREECTKGWHEHKEKMKEKMKKGPSHEHPRSEHPGTEHPH